MSTRGGRRAGFRLVVVVLLPLLAACGGSSTPATLPGPGGGTSAASTPSPTTSQSLGPSSTIPVQASAVASTFTAPATAAGGGNTFTNPVYDSDFPDPFVLKVGDTYYAYATTNGVKSYQTLRSKDLVHWTEGPDAMPRLAPWVSGDTWAPEVLRGKGGKYILYYTAHSFADDRQCLGHAISSRAQGPFVDRDSRPFVCQADLGGSIDASPFRDAGGALYLYWKNDGNCCGMDTYIYVQKLSSDGLKEAGKPVKLFKEDPSSWEGGLVEAPQMWRQAGRYYLFYSANAYASELYAAGYATCEGPLGPCKKASENPILKTACEAAGPGHNTIFKDDEGETWTAYHAWPPDAIGSSSPGRVLWIDRLLWKDGKPVVHGPTCGPQPLP